MTLEPIGTIGFLQERQTADFSRAQMLARVGHPTGTIATEAEVDKSVAQAYRRRNIE